ncbi:helix-turn-helix domain-containing protein [Pararhizobium mangrovi]|uniref:Helix-turn-helix domain-containing protein n=1 Tax=Pararhizobium mangrovi TaxID=2590452 RepID=A0A506U9Y1_9HYPH|nr:AraC family transcriptional regulator [Pararhizobium mangrovi]TPW30338.1 helix-turn-helix domain-containing protein [Pararhizobium mangrovi]
MEPDLEVVQIRSGESFTAWAHGYPYHTVRWHFHPEYELHLVTETTGRYFIGDFIGEFQPGNLVLTGPNLPHNWVSMVPEGTSVKRRCVVLQFTERFIDSTIRVLPELAAFEMLLAESRHGVLFTPETAKKVQPIFLELLEAQGTRRIMLFMTLVDVLARSSGRELLASSNYLPDPSGFMSAATNRALAYIRENLTEPFTEADLAEIAGMSRSAFSRSFRRHTGFSLVRYVNRLRINLACQLLMNGEDRPITEICYAVGFNNLSNFNRQFLAQKGMPPSRFRALHGENIMLAA